MWWDNPTHLRWVRATWIPRWFNQEILKVLLPDEAEAAFDWLTRQASIVVGERGRWRYHEVVRTALRREGLQRTPDALAADHDRLAAYWRERVAAEAVYHALLGTRPSDGVRLLTERYVRGLRSDEDPHAIVAAALVARAESAAPADLTAVDLVHAHWSAYRAGDRLAEQDARDRLLELDVLAAAERATLLAQVVEQTDTDPQQSTAIAARPARGGRWRFGRRKPPPAASARLTALVEYGDSLRAAGKHAEAVRVLDEALRISSDDPNARVGRGEALRALGRTSEAIQDLSVALKYAPDNVWAWTLRSAAYLACDQFERAHADAAQAVRREPRNPWALALRGLARCQVDRYPTPPAMLDLRRALELDPSITWARAALDDWEALVESAPPVADPDED
jgi:tetratricopeptide (TPR) repeat protein